MAEAVPGGSSPPRRPQAVQASATRPIAIRAGRREGIGSSGQDSGNDTGEGSGASLTVAGRPREPVAATGCAEFGASEIRAALPVHPAIPGRRDANPAPE
ncbi:hypothetical protein JCM2811A_03430 [Methylorubrum rhodinum]